MVAEDGADRSGAAGARPRALEDVVEGHPELLYARHGWLMEAHVLIPELRAREKTAKRKR